MRISALIREDIRLQLRHGFYALYTILTIFYILLLSAVPAAWNHTVAAFAIFFDPATMGLFFMGAMMLFERNQRIQQALAVSPVSPNEYICGKLASFGLISLLVAAVLALFSHSLLLPVLAGTLLASFMFTLLGIIAASHIKSLNQFLLYPSACLSLRLYAKQSFPISNFCLYGFNFKKTDICFRHHPCSCCIASLICCCQAKSGGHVEKGRGG